MPKRNLILFIIVFLLTAISISLYLYLRPEKNISPSDEVDTDTNFFSQFNPFKTSSTLPPVAPGADVPEDQVPAEDESKIKLKKVSSMPIAGFTVFTKERIKDVPLAPLLVEEGVGGGDDIITPPRPSGTPPQKGGETKKPTPLTTEFAPALRYVDKATGNIYQTFADKIEEKKFSMTIIPKVYEAHFGNRGETVVMRYLKEDGKTIETFVGILPKEVLNTNTLEGSATEEKVNEVKGSFLPDNIENVSISPDGSRMFYLFKSGENMIGTILSFLNNKKVQIFDSPFTEWLSSWPTNNTIALSTKPSSDIFGYMYTIDSAGKNLSKVLGGNGLSTLISPSGKLILYGSNSLSDSLSLSIYNPGDRTSIPLSIRTMPEKCVWGSGSDVIYCSVPKSIIPGLYPDIWYRGEVSFNDQIWKIDVSTGNANLLADGATMGIGEIDGAELVIEREEKYLFFVNKKDSFLWELDLK